MIIKAIINDRKDQFGFHVWEGMCDKLFYNTHNVELRNERMIDRKSHV